MTLMRHVIYMGYMEKVARFVYETKKNKTKKQVK